MYFDIYDLKGNTSKVVQMFSKELHTKNFNIHNIYRLQNDNRILRFNIVLQNENNNVLSRETWYKVSNAFICEEYNILLIPEFPTTDLAQKFKEEVFPLFDFNFQAKGFTQNSLQNVIGDNSNFISKVSYLNRDKELYEECIDIPNLIEREVNLLEISYFNNSNSLIRFNSEGRFYCNDEETIYKNLDIFKYSISPSA